MNVVVSRKADGFPKLVMFSPYLVYGCRARSGQPCTSLVPVVVELCVTWQIESNLSHLKVDEPARLALAQLNAFLEHSLRC